MKIDKIKRSSMWLVLLLCTLLLGGCSAGNTTDWTDNKTSEELRTEDMQSGDAQSEHTLADGTSASDGGTDGSVVKADFETANGNSNKANTKNETTDKDNNGSSNKEITKDEAKKIALDKVPGAKNIQIEKDRENGKVVYEGEIHYNNMEYDFEIDAATGKILSWEEDKED